MQIFRHTRKEKGALKRLTLCYYGADEEIRTLDLLITNRLESIDYNNRQQ